MYRWHASYEQPQGRRSVAAARAERARHEARILRPGTADRAEAFRSWLLSGSDAERTPAMRESAARCGMNLDSRQMHFKLPVESMKSLRPEDQKEWEVRTALGTTSGAVGLYTVPDEMMRQLEVSLLAFGGMRQYATVLRTDSGAALPIPTVDDTGNKGVILSENTAAAEGSITFSQDPRDARDDRGGERRRGTHSAVAASPAPADSEAGN